MYAKIGSIVVVLVVFLSVGISPALAQSDDGGSGVDIPENPMSDEDDNSNSDSDDESSPWDSITFRFSSAITLNSVEYGDGVATAYLTFDADKATSSSRRVVMTDGTRNKEGELNRRVYNLKDGKNVFRIPLDGNGRGAVVFDIAGTPYLSVEDVPYNFTPDVDKPILVLVMGMMATMGLMFSTELYSNRKDQRPQRKT